MQQVPSMIRPLVMSSISLAEKWIQHTDLSEIQRILDAISAMLPALQDDTISPDDLLSKLGEMITVWKNK